MSYEIAIFSIVVFGIAALVCIAAGFYFWDIWK